MPPTRSERAEIQCDLTAIAPMEREAHQARTRRLFQDEVREREELTDGYAFRFDGEQFDELCSFIALERLCCPFWSFGVDVAPRGGPIWLRLTGPEGAKEILK